MTPTYSDSLDINTLKTMLTDAEKLVARLRTLIDSRTGVKTTTTEALRPTMTEAEQTRLREATVRSYQRLGLSKAGAEAAAKPRAERF